MLTDEQRHAVLLTFLFVVFLAVQPKEASMVRVVRTAVASVVTVVAIAWLLVSCAEPPASTDAGRDPEVARCCDWFILPWLDKPHECLDTQPSPRKIRPGLSRRLRIRGAAIDRQHARKRENLTGSVLGKRRRGRNIHRWRIQVACGPSSH